MNTRLILVVAFLTVGCASSSPLIGFKGDVNVTADNVSLKSNNPFFGNQAIEVIKTNEIVDDRADYFLNVILDAYWNQLTGIEPTESETAGLRFDIRTITVKKGTTINFVDPGPIYIMTMKVDVYEDGVFSFDDRYRVKVNMAEVVSPNKFFNWLSNAEKENTENQIATFNMGLRYLYRNMLFEHFDISLQL
ncbi:MAG: hypothetical protein ED557_12455 [Balneola sp.]|nr:MAG: hypothetical protein ED557_12455 [Balneola sp.]